MAFSIGGAPSSGGLFGSSFPAFGASSSAFGSTTPTFGSSQPQGNPFGSAFGQGTPAFGASTPVFGASASSAPAFGASLFQGSTSSFGGGGSFWASQPASSPGLGLALAPFGQQQQQQQQQQQASQYQTLVSKDNKPVVQSTAWVDIQPQGQNYLLEIEKLVLQTREDLRQLEQSDRLQNSQEMKQDLKEDEKNVKHVLQSLSKELRVHDEAVTAFREKVLQLRRDTETGVRTFVRSKAWRDASKSSQHMLPPNVREQLNGPVVLPSMFLRHLVPDLQETLRDTMKAVGDLETGLPLGAASRQSAASDTATALEATASNVYDFVMRVAASLSKVQERLAEAKEAFLADRAAHGDDTDPFAEAEEQEVLREREAKRRSVTMLRQMAPSQAAPAAAAPLALGAPQPASTQAATLGQSLFGGFGAAPALALPGSTLNFAGSTGGSLFGGASAGSPGLFGGAGAFGTSNTLSSQPSRKGKGRK